MKLALSTNWCNRRLTSGEAIADAALSLGFDELELGFHTTIEQVPGFKARLSQIPVASIHAFCPVPISAPQGYPELYQLASLDPDTRALAHIHTQRNIEFAADMGASTVVLHAGRVPLSRLFRPLDTTLLREKFAALKNDTTAPKYQKMLSRAHAARAKNAPRYLDAFKVELASLIPVLERHHITLALENLPYLEGFPNEDELLSLLTEFKGAPIRGWFDTGHDRVRRMNGWITTALPTATDAPHFAGMHLNDVLDFDDNHFAPGDGHVDFAALKPFAEAVRHIVFEPSCTVSEEDLRRGIEHIRTIWNLPHVDRA